MTATLPASWYTDPAMLALERAVVCTGQRARVGTGDELAALALDTLERAVEHEVVEGQHGVPVQPP